MTDKIRVVPDTVADEEVVLKDVGRKPRTRSRPRDPNSDAPVLYVAADCVVESAEDAAKRKLEENVAIGIEMAPTMFVPGHVVLDAEGQVASTLTWPDYIAWRKTKCPPYDYENGPARATSAANKLSVTEGVRKARALEEIARATHEFVGEVAELGQLFLEHGPAAFFGEPRDKLIDEIGDILFCGCWVFDAWGVNPLSEADDIELLRVTEENELAMIAQTILANSQEVIMGNKRVTNLLQMVVMRFMLEAQTLSGLLCNSYKKLRYQNREQNVQQQIARVAGVFLVVNQILVVANSNTEEALRVNQAKLDKRYPDGYFPGVGGGIRTGKGA